MYYVYFSFVVGGVFHLECSCCWWWCLLLYGYMGVASFCIYVCLVSGSKSFLFFLIFILCISHSSILRSHSFICIWHWRPFVDIIYFLVSCDSLAPNADTVRFMCRDGEVIYPLVHIFVKEFQLLYNFCFVLVTFVTSWPIFDI